VVEYADEQRQRLQSVAQSDPVAAVPRRKLTGVDPELVEPELAKLVERELIGS